MNRSLSIARAVSIIGHPFLFASLLVLVASWHQEGRSGAAKTTSAVVIGFIALGLFVARQRRSGRWQTVDASVPTERPALYAAGFIILGLLAIYFRYIQPSPGPLRGIFVVSLMLLVAAILNRRLKVSLHVAFAVFAGVVLLMIAPACGAASLAFVPLLAWSRLKMQRHTRAEVIAGFLLGAAGAAVELWG